MSNFDNFLQDTIQQDKLNFDVDPSSINHLRNHIRSQSLKSTTRLNTILPLNAFRLMPLSGLKVAVACSLIIAFIGFKHINTQTSPLVDIDSTLVSPAIDTTLFSPFIDTINSNL